LALEGFDTAGQPLVLYDTWPTPDEEDIAQQKQFDAQ
jgi:hypothetical protein